MRATLDEKIGYQMEPYLIIGACNPVLARQAIEAEREIGTLLPCNVVVRADQRFTNPIMGSKFSRSARSD